MIQKTYYKTKDYCKVKFSLRPENADSVAIAGLNGDWKTLVNMSKKKDGTFTAEVSLPKESIHEFKYLGNNGWLCPVNRVREVSGSIDQYSLYFTPRSSGFVQESV
jgi:hypothetical protein